MVTTFPCAQTVTAHRPRRFFGRRLPPWAQHFYSAEYPRLPKGQGRAVREGLVDGQVAITATRFRNEVSFSPDELRWVPTGVYTDPDIEREKLHMWGRILNWAYAVATQDPDDHHWVTIVKRSRGLGAGGLE
ncbi:hypothetical protein GT347_18390 [Xylophilus rhododendri]|uniref:Uncharacterized protein n=1 Tax=Xylophilus rhododendri TaxID=2697032 RepID=A0A857JAK6_9BURK|nr:hypothetical protein [Xylophilus rhododendri]QHI99775.1 hypothetical protein GT347_18390 [Xylophilus rhododendri]